jgi:hypothetical protein
MPAGGISHLQGGASEEAMAATNKAQAGALLRRRRILAKQR